MIQVSEIDKSYGQQIIFNKISFSINAGERIGLIGRNGHGKTTLFRMILGEEHPDAGAIRIPNHYSIAHLSQHIHFTEETILKEGCSSLKTTEDGRDETYRVKNVLQGLGFSSKDFDRHPDELSGGFQVRLNLAKVLISEPNLLLLDEPTNYLDIVSARWLNRFLLSWKNELMLITHDRAFMDSVTTHTMGIHRCRIRKISGSTLKFSQQVLQEEEIFEKTRVNDDKKRKETEQFINRFRAQATKASAVQSRVKALLKKEKLEKLSEIKTLDFEFNASPLSGKWLLRAEDLSFSFNPEDPLLIDRLSFSVSKNDRIGIIGKNGQGKTTLLNLLAGELSPTAGIIGLHQDLKIAYFGQTNINRLNLDNTVEQEILGAHPDQNRKAARSICGAMMFDGDKALKRIAVLSGGERSRVLLGKLLACPANLLLLDEPTNHLDMESVDSLLEAIDAFNGAVMIVTHSEMILRSVATRLIVFDDNQVKMFEGTYQDFLDRVGWKDEIAPAPCTGSKAQKNKPVNKKDMRRIRAEILAERSKTLAALEKRIREVENTIEELEERIDHETQLLLEASQNQNGESIKKSSKSISESRKKMDLLFGELEELTVEYENKARSFEERLSDPIQSGRV
ncbi:MAG: ABC-F family ATP-binding cassette domain-containing protein [bacterium]